METRIRAARPRGDCVPTGVDIDFKIAKLRDGTDAAD